METTTLPGDLRATSALNLNKQTPCQLRILVGDTIQAMGETMAMAMAKSCSASKCYLSRVYCCDLLSHYRHGCVKEKRVVLCSLRTNFDKKQEGCLFLAPQAFGLSPCPPISHHALQGEQNIVLLNYSNYSSSGGTVPPLPLAAPRWLQ